MAGMATARYYPGTFGSHSSKPLDTRSIAYLATGVGALCAFSVFFLLCQRDHSFLLETDQPEKPVVIETAGVSRTVVPVPNAAHAPAVVPAKKEVAATHVRHAAEAVPENIVFHIAKSKHFERVGPISVGLWKTDPKHETFDLSVLVDGHRFDKKHVRSDEALAISIGGSQPMELIVNRVGKNEISGYLSKPRQIASR